MRRVRVSIPVDASLNGCTAFPGFMKIFLRILSFVVLHIHMCLLNDF